MIKYEIPKWILKLKGDDKVCKKQDFHNHSCRLRRLQPETKPTFLSA